MSYEDNDKDSEVYSPFEDGEGGKAFEEPFYSLTKACARGSKKVALEKTQEGFPGCLLPKLLENRQGDKAREEDFSIIILRNNR